MKTIFSNCLILKYSVYVVAVFCTLFFFACKKNTNELRIVECATKDELKIKGCKLSSVYTESIDSATGYFNGSGTTNFSHTNDFFTGNGRIFPKYFEYNEISYDGCGNTLAKYEEKWSDTYGRSGTNRYSIYSYRGNLLSQILFYSASGNKEFQLVKMGKGYYFNNTICGRFYDTLGFLISWDSAYYNDLGDIVKRVRSNSNGYIEISKYDTSIVNPFSEYVNLNSFEKPSKHLLLESILVNNGDSSPFEKLDQVKLLPNGNLREAIYYAHYNKTVKATYRYTYSNCK